ncbi:SPOR domain-containing protein [Aromatoleum petrolei]|uniref:SPOR domain-containing protein n=1 Tax=Aromatoleum petrolei TaxID=76116 RepID=A0ABX1MUL6_9RHOO|nr:SPOR domain-containing protein [Aromatoleum petrolei]NMF90030.1 hypothetical protein [Aromatoleum petrolei]QTQ36306.1 Sporulation related domain-containing protein [Aromatoleum petrolei]
MSRAFEAQDAAASQSLRKASLKRALVATLVLMALTASLRLVEDRETAVPQAAPADPAPATSSTPAADSAAAAAPAAAVEAPAPVAAEEGAPLESGHVASAAAQSGPQAAAPQGATLAPAASPPGWDATAVAVAPSVPVEPAREGSAVPAPAEAAPADAAAERRDAAPRADAPRLHAGPPPGPGYLIQLGVFLDTANAESMRRELERKGYPAHLQARVVLGPYPDRGAALAAQEKVRRERKLDGMILGPRK